MAAGGGTNHRMGLYDAILIKENHAALAGGVGEAVRRAREAQPEPSGRGRVPQPRRGPPGRRRWRRPAAARQHEPGRSCGRRSRRPEPSNGGPELEASGGITLENVGRGRRDRRRLRLGRRADALRSGARPEHDAATYRVARDGHRSRRAATRARGARPRAHRGREPPLTTRRRWRPSTTPATSTSPPTRSTTAPRRCWPTGRSSTAPSRTSETRSSRSTTPTTPSWWRRSHGGPMPARSADCRRPAAVRAAIPGDLRLRGRGAGLRARLLRHLHRPAAARHRPRARPASPAGSRRPRATR